MILKATANFSGTGTSPLTTNITMNCNNMNITCSTKEADDNDILDLVFVFPLCFLILFTCAANLLVMILVHRDHKLMSMVNVYVFSMALADFAVGLFVMTGMMTYHMYGHWGLGHAMCIAWIMVDYSLCSVSMMHLCIIAYDRFRAGRNYKTKRAVITRNKATIRAVCAWAAGFLMWIPSTLYYKHTDYGFDFNACKFTPDFSFVMTQTILFYHIPFVSLVALYSHVIWSLQNTTQRQDSTKSNTVDGETPTLNVVQCKLPGTVKSLLNSQSIYSISGILSHHVGSNNQSPVSEISKSYAADFDHEGADSASTKGHATADVKQRICIMPCGRVKLIVDLDSESGELIVPVVADGISAASLSMYESNNGENNIEVMDLSDCVDTPSQPHSKVTPLSEETSITDSRKSIEVSQSSGSEPNDAKQIAESSMIDIYIDNDSAESRTHDTITVKEYVSPSCMNSQESDVPKEDTSAPMNKKSTVCASDMSNLGTATTIIPRRLSPASIQLQLKGNNTVETYVQPFTTTTAAPKNTATLHSHIVPSSKRVTQSLKAAGSSTRVPIYSQGNIARRQRSRQTRASRTLTVIVVTFLICWLPFLIIWPLDNHCHCIIDSLYRSSNWLSYLNSTINPALYFLFNKDFRSALTRLFRRNQNISGKDEKWILWQHIYIYITCVQVHNLYHVFGNWAFVWHLR